MFETILTPGVVCPCLGAIYIYMAIIFKHSFLKNLFQNLKAYDLETWPASLRTQALQSFYK